MPIRSMPIQRHLCAALVAATLLTTVGCVTPGPTAPVAVLTPAEQKLRVDKERFDNTVIGGVMRGAMIGAGVGAVAVLLTGGDRKDAARGAVAGAVAGGLLGGADGYTKAKLQQSKMDEVGAIQSTVADIRKDNANLQAAVESSNAVLEESRLRLTTMRADLNAKRITAAQADAARKREEQNLALMKANHKKAQETLAQYSKASATYQASVAQGSPAARRDLDSEISRMAQSVAALERSISGLSGSLTVSAG